MIYRTILLAALCLGLLTVACGKDPQQSLKKMNIAYSPDSFVTRAERGNIKAVGLFLEAGMDPNTRDDGGNTAQHGAARRSTARSYDD